MCLAPMRMSKLVDIPYGLSHAISYSNESASSYTPRNPRHFVMEKAPTLNTNGHRRELLQSLYLRPNMCVCVFARARVCWGGCARMALSCCEMQSGLHRPSPTMSTERAANDLRYSHLHLPCPQLHAPNTLRPRSKTIAKPSSPQR